MLYSKKLTKMVMEKSLSLNASPYSMTKQKNLAFPKEVCCSLASSNQNNCIFVQICTNESFISSIWPIQMAIEKFHWSNFLFNCQNLKNFCSTKNWKCKKKRNKYLSSICVVNNWNKTLTLILFLLQTIFFLKYSRTRRKFEIFRKMKSVLIFCLLT